MFTQAQRETTTRGQCPQTNPTFTGTGKGTGTGGVAAEPSDGALIAAAGIAGRGLSPGPGIRIVGAGPVAVGALWLSTGYAMNFGGTVKCGGAQGVRSQQRVGEERLSYAGKVKRNAAPKPLVGGLLVGAW